MAAPALWADTPPTVTLVNQDISVRAGEEVRFAATISGPGTIAIQWYRQGAPVEGGSSAELVIAHAAESDVGTYQIVAENEFGSTLGGGRVELTVTPAVEFTEHPESLAVRVGESIRLTAQANGEGLVMHWQRGNLRLPAEPDGSLFIESATFADRGVYFAVGVGIHGENQSNLARVDVFASSDPGILQLDSDWQFDLRLTGGNFSRISPAPGGGFVVTGAFAQIDAHATRGLAKFDAMGQIDTGFVSTLDIDERIYAMKVMADGKILLGGDFARFGERDQWGGLIRLNADGSLDSDFRGELWDNHTVQAISQMPSGAVYVSSQNYTESVDYTIKRLLPSGERDPTFNQSRDVTHWIRQITVSDAGLIHAVGYAGDLSVIYTLDQAGNLIWTFQEPVFRTIGRLHVDAAGRLYAQGVKHGSSTTMVWRRFSSEGQLDESYSGEQSHRSWGHSDLLSDGSLLISSIRTLERIDADGQWVGSVFQEPTELGPFVLGEEGLLFYLSNQGYFRSAESTIFKLSSDFSTRTQLVQLLMRPGTATGILAWPDGGFLVVGNFDQVDGSPRNHAALVTADGRLQSSPAHGFFSGPVVHARRASSGDLYFAGDFFQAFGGPAQGLARISANGVPDTSFAANLQASGVNRIQRNNAFRVLSDGSVILGGPVIPIGQNSSQVGMIKILPSGVPDTAFNNALQDWNSYLNSPDLVEHLDRRIMLPGFFTHDLPVIKFRWANPDGTLWADEPVIRNRDRFTIAVEEDTAGNVWSIGYSEIHRYAVGGDTPNLLNPPLPLPNNRYETEEYARLLRQPDGKMIAYGNLSFRNPGLGDSRRHYVARFNFDGSVDLDFEVKGLSTMVDSLLQLEDGGFLIGTNGQVSRSIAPQRPEVSIRSASAEVAPGDSLRLFADVSGYADSYQWYRNGTPIAGATSAVLRIPAPQANDTAVYTVVARNGQGAAASERIEITVVGESSQAAGLHRASVPVFHADETPLLQVIGRISIAGDPDQLKWSVLIPEGWALSPFHHGSADTVPGDLATGLAEWTWQSPDSDRVQISYDLIPPADAVGRWEFPAMVSIWADGEEFESMANPDPVILRILGRSQHAADFNGDQSIDLSELLRVIELYNTRSGTSRTGRYRLNARSADGFDTDLEQGALGEVSVFHSADTDNDAAISLSELLRVIELYNVRSGTTRTGRYKVDEVSPDGFAPDLD